MLSHLAERCEYRPTPPEWANCLDRDLTEYSELFVPSFHASTCMRTSMLINILQAKPLCRAKQLIFRMQARIPVPFTQLVAESAIVETFEEGHSGAFYVIFTLRYVFTT